MEMAATNALTNTLGLTPEVAQGLSLGLFILATLLFMLVIFAAMKRRSRGQSSLPGAAIVLLGGGGGGVIAVASFVGALILKLS